MKYIHNIIFIIFSLVIALVIVKNTTLTENYYEDGITPTTYESNMKKNEQIKAESKKKIKKDKEQMKIDMKKYEIEQKNLRNKNKKETDKSDEHLEKAQNFFKDVGKEWNRLFDIDFF